MSFSEREGLDGKIPQAALIRIFSRRNSARYYSADMKKWENLPADRTRHRWVL